MRNILAVLLSALKTYELKPNAFADSDRILFQKKFLGKWLEVLMPLKRLV